MSAVMNTGVNSMLLSLRYVAASKRNSITSRITIKSRALVVGEMGLHSLHIF